MTEPPVDSPAEEPELRCGRCGAPHDRYQEYCLNCGFRLAAAYEPRARAAWSREMWSRESPFWLWAALAALLLVALISGAIVALAATGDEKPAERRAARPNQTSTLQVLTDITTSNLPPTFTVQPTTTLFGTTTGTTGTTTTGTTTTSSNRVISWPPGKRGYTVVIASIPTSQPRSRAEAKAREAINKGLDEVGVLNSADYSSLRDGYWVVFSGVHDTEAEARTGLSTARTHYPVAYIREVTP